MWALTPCFSPTESLEVPHVTSRARSQRALGFSRLLPGFSEHHHWSCEPTSKKSGHRDATVLQRPSGSRRAWARPALPQTGYQTSKKVFEMTPAPAVFFKDFTYLFLERGDERERNINVQDKHRSIASRIPPARDLVRNPGMCPDQELNQRPLGLQARAQSTEPHFDQGPSHLLTATVGQTLRKNHPAEPSQVPTVSD